MTTRVFDCERRVFIPPPAPLPRTFSARSEPGIKLTPAVLVALLVVPVAGAAEPPFGWLFAAAAAASAIYLAAALGLRVPWGWLFVLISAAGVVTPRGEVQVVGPALFTAAVLCLVLWLTNRDDARRRVGRSAEVGPRERAAQLMMGLSGERQVGRVLA